MKTLVSTLNVLLNSNSNEHFQCTDKCMEIVFSVYPFFLLQLTEGEDSLRRIETRERKNLKRKEEFSKKQIY